MSAKAESAKAESAGALGAEIFGGLGGTMPAEADGVALAEYADCAGGAEAGGENLAAVFGRGRD